MSQFRSKIDVKSPIEDAVVRVIINRIGTTDEVLAEKVPELTEDLESLYDVESENYVGKFESNEYKKLRDAWVEQGSDVEHYTYADEEVIEVMMMLSSLESLPMSYYDKDNGVLVAGPFPRHRITAMMQNFDKK